MLSAADVALIIDPPAPAKLDTLETYLDRLGLLSRGFVFAELVKRGSPRHLPVPPKLWRNTIAPLILAGELRRRLVTATGAKGLRVYAFYRPAGGADDSQHKNAGAIDLDLLRADRHLAASYARIAAELWHELDDLPIGIGTYAPDGVLRTRRVHLDFGFRRRCWQGTGRNAHGTTTWSKNPAVLRLRPKAQPQPEAPVEVGETDEVASTEPTDRTA